MSVVDVAAACPGQPALIALVGSHAYGTARPDSDRDYRGFYIAPTRALFRVNGPAETFDRHEPDVTLHELRKFASLALKANPTVLETLWADPVHMTPDGQLLRENRRLFLSRHVLKTYGGYALGQLAKARRGSGGSRGQAHYRREKFIGHTYRLMECGIHALEHGDLKLKVDDVERYWARARQPLDRVEAEFRALDAQLRAAYARTSLPEEPAREAIDALLESIRLRHLELASVLSHA